MGDAPADVVKLHPHKPHREDTTPLLWQCSAKLELAAELAQRAVDEAGGVVDAELIREVSNLSCKLAIAAQRMLYGVVPHNSESA